MPPSYEHRREANATVPAIQPPPVDSHALKMEPVAAVTEARGLYEKNDQQNAMTLPAETVNTEFSEDEIEKSINCLDNRLIGKGGSGNVYKGRLRNTDVAIKKLHRESMQEESDFSRKVAVLGRVRHPNLVTLIGVCREVFGLVYEFLPNGSLQDRLECRSRMAQLKWQVRTKIMREVWTALTFLHSNKPQPVVHGNLKLSKVLLDSNLACKVEAFGISQSNGIGKPTTQDDVHSFGIIVLQLLTGLPPEDVAKVVEDAMEKEELHTVLDPTAGNWPIALAKQLADVGLRCIKMSREERPDLVGDVWKELSHKNNAGILTSGQDDDGPPNYFICPITRDVMENPHFAADGHTYELEAILQWIHGDDGKSSDRSVRSPMTNLKLEHLELTPNLALGSEIREWKEKLQQKQDARIFTESLKGSAWFGAEASAD
ncbi:U-box domain-containing protein 70-like [Miscanthus floridulus]|uniref:U-box domain-containing protein 70-like n=1 Tax=Miscanthus floridulus TaxID=154761 RepID=UPI0034596CAD